MERQQYGTVLTSIFSSSRSKFAEDILKIIEKKQDIQVSKNPQKISQTIILTKNRVNWAGELKLRRSASTLSLITEIDAQEVGGSRLPSL